MNRVIKVILKRFVFILLFTTPILNASSRGFGGGFIGGMTGSMLGSAITRPRTRTVVVKETGNVTRDELIRLEQTVRADLDRLFYRQRENEYKIMDLEREIERLKRKLPIEEEETLPEEKRVYKHSRS